MTSLRTYSTFIKIEHTLFSLPLLFAGALLARKGWPDLRVTFLILVAAVGARIVALALNRIIDRRIDAKNPRTRDRHLSAGTMKLYEAWLIVIAGLGLYLSAAWLLSDFCFRWSWIPLVGFAAYPFFKRFTKWTHVGLGIVWSVIPAAGFFAMTPTIRGLMPAVILGVFSLFWLAGFDIIYATMDETFDREAGLFSLPAAWGRDKALTAAAVFHALSFVALAGMYVTWFSGPITVMLLVIIGILLVIEQKLSSYVDLAFFQINAVIGFVVLFFVIAGLKGV